MKYSSDRSFYFFIVCAVALLFALAPLAMSASNLDEKARYERVLETKVDDLLSSLLGPGKAKVMVQATIDFSTKENIVSGAEGAEIPAAAVGEGENAPWWSGIMENVRQSASAIPETATLRKETVFPQAMIKKLTVTLALSETMSAQEADKVRAVVTEMLEMDPGRGDKLTVVRAGFAPVWYTPEMLGVLVKYGVMAVVLIIAMGILGFGFIKMATAMSSMAGAGQQKISMEMSGFGGSEAPEGEAGALPGPKASRSAAPEGEAESAGPAGPVVINIPSDKLSTLVGLLTKDTPEDIALIAVHLPQAQRRRFIGMFPPEMGAAIVASVAKVRFVEPEMIVKIKEELEKRLSGSVGGYEKALEFMTGMGVKEKRSLYDNMLKTSPEVAAQVRKTLIFPEDLEKISEKDFGTLSGGVSVEQWSVAAWAMSEAGREKLKAQLTKRAWQMVEQALKFDRPPEQKIDRALDEIISVLGRLIAEGRITSHAAATAELPYSPAPGPAAGHRPPPPSAELSSRMKVPSGRDIT